MSKKKVTVREAAELLGLTQEAVRKRIERGSIEYERQQDGRLYVFLDDVQDTSRTAGDDLLASKDERIDDLKEQNAYLQEQVEAEREARRRADHIIAQLSSRIPELEPADQEQTPDEQSHTASSQPPTSQPDPDPSNQDAETHKGAHEPRRPWWKRILAR